MTLKEDSEAPESSGTNDLFRETTEKLLWTSLAGIFSVIDGCPFGQGLRLHQALISGTFCENYYYRRGNPSL